MSNDELIQQLLAVTARAQQAGRPIASIIGSLEIVKAVVVGANVQVERRQILPVRGLPQLPDAKAP